MFVTFFFFLFARSENTEKNQKKKKNEWVMFTPVCCIRGYIVYNTHDARRVIILSRIGGYLIARGLLVDLISVVFVFCF